MTTNPDFLAGVDWAARQLEAAAVVLEKDARRSVESRDAATGVMRTAANAIVRSAQPHRARQLRDLAALLREEAKNL